MEYTFSEDRLCYVHTFSIRALDVSFFESNRNYFEKIGVTQESEEVALENRYPYYNAPEGSKDEVKGGC